MYIYFLSNKIIGLTYTITILLKSFSHKFKKKRERSNLLKKPASDAFQNTLKVQVCDLYTNYYVISLIITVSDII